MTNTLLVVCLINTQILLHRTEKAEILACHYIIMMIKVMMNAFTFKRRLIRIVITNMMYTNA